MPKSKTITTAMRLDIINAVVTYTMAHREKVQEDAELVLSQAIYRQCVPDSLLEQLMKLPKEFLTWHAHLRVQFQKDDTKLDHNIDMKMPVPSTVRYDHYTAFICTNTDLMEQAQEIQKRKNKLKKQRDTFGQPEGSVSRTRRCD